MVFTEVELYARSEIAYENYAKTVNIEARTMIDMSCKDILPTAIDYAAELERALSVKRSLGTLSDKDAMFKLSAKINLLYNDLYEYTEKLREDIEAVSNIKDFKKSAEYFCNVVIPDMDILREKADSLELIIPASKWPFPVYSDLMFNI